MSTPPLNTTLVLHASDSPTTVRHVMWVADLPPTAAHFYGMDFPYAPVMVTWIVINGHSLSGGGAERRPSVTLYRKDVGRETSLTAAHVKVDFFKSRLRGSGFDVNDEDLDAMAQALQTCFEAVAAAELAAP